MLKIEVVQTLMNALAATPSSNGQFFTPNDVGVFAALFILSLQALPSPSRNSTASSFSFELELEIV